MESVVNSVDSSITSQFQLKLAPQNDFCTDRRMVRWYPQGSNVYSPAGVRLLRFSISPGAAEGWLDPYSVMMHFTVQNSGYNAAAPLDTRLHLANGSWCFFKRCRILCGGTLIEDISSWSRLYAMQMLFAPIGYQKDVAVAAGERGSIVNATEKFAFVPLCGLLTQSKALPIRYMNLTIELELCDNFPDALMENSLIGGGVSGQSNSYILENVFITGETMTLDGSLDNEVTSHLLKGKSLSLSLQSWFTSQHTVSQNWQIALARAFTRIRGVYVNMLDSSQDKEANTFRYPSISDSQFFELQLQLGSKLFPEQKMSSLPEFFQKLQSAVGSHTSILSHSAIDLTGYKSDRFIAAIGMQKVLGDSEHSNFSGISSKSGSLLSLRSAHSTSNIDQVFVVIHHDLVVQISESGVECFD